MFLKNNIQKIYLLKVLLSMFFAIPVIVLFWQDNGLSMTEIMLLQSFCSIISVLLEIPSGYFADLYGRRWSLIIASSSMLIGMSMYAISTNLVGFLIAELFFGIYLAFLSGSVSAFIYDDLKDSGNSTEYLKIFGNVTFVSMIALAVSNIMGSIIASYELVYSIYGSIPFLILAVGVASSLKEPKRQSLLIEKSHLKEVVRIFKLVLTKKSKIKWFIVYGSIVFAFNQSALWLYQPYFELIKVEIIYYGLIFALFQVVAAITSKFSYRIENYFGEKHSLIILFFLVLTSFILMSNFIFLFSFSFCFLQQIARGFLVTVVDDYINKLTTSDIRATVLSVYGLFRRLIYALIIPIFGYVADIFSLTQAFGFVAILFFIVTLPVLIVMRKLGFL